MPLKTTFETRDRYLHAVVTGEFTPEAGVEVMQLALAAVLTTGLRRVVADITAFETDASAMDRMAWALGVEQSVVQFGEAHGFTPRVAIHGKAPFIGPYRPGTEYLTSRRIPVRVYDSMDEALAWVDGDDL